jgi:hypothetical protein
MRCIHSGEDYPRLSNRAMEGRPKRFPLLANQALPGNSFKPYHF